VAGTNTTKPARYHALPSAFADTPPAFSARHVAGEDSGVLQALPEKFRMEK
jgi:hypothetical protein